MNIYANKIKKNKALSASTTDSMMHSSGEPVFRFIDNRPKAIAQRKLQKMVKNSSHVKKNIAVMQQKKSDFSNKNRVLQKKFTSKGEKNKKIRKWVGVTKKALRESGEDLLLALFISLDKADKENEWNIREPFIETKITLKNMLDDNEDGPVTTILDEEYPTRALRGERSGMGYKRLSAWDLEEDRGELDSDTHTALSQVSRRTGDWRSERIDPMYGADTGELGPGFYTVGGHGDVGTKGIRDEFGKTGKVPREVLTFRIENTELVKLVNDNVQLANFLIYVLQHPDGYPPGCDYMASIEAINKMGKVLIFPDKTTEVDVDTEGTKYSYNTYREINGAVGAHGLIIGPQARDSLDGIRQICARGYLGDIIINEASRSTSKLGPRET